VHVPAAELVHHLVEIPKLPECEGLARHEVHFNAKQVAKATHLGHLELVHQCGFDRAEPAFVADQEQVVNVDCNKDDVLGHAVLATDNLGVETVVLFVALKSLVDHERVKHVVPLEWCLMQTIEAFEQ